MKYKENKYIKTEISKYLINYIICNIVYLK